MIKLISLCIGLILAQSHLPTLKQVFLKSCNPSIIVLLPGPVLTDGVATKLIFLSTIHI